MSLTDQYGRTITESGGVFSCDGVSIDGVSKEKAIELFNSHAPEGWRESRPANPRISALDFWNKFSDESKAAISTSPKLNVFIITALATGFVDLESPETIQGMEFAVSLGVITEDEKKAILTP